MALVQNMHDVKSEFEFDQWAASKDKNNLDSVPPRRHTSKIEYAGARPAKRFRPDEYNSAGEALVSYSGSAYPDSSLLQGENETFFQNRVIGTTRQTAGQDAEPPMGNRLWSVPHQVNWQSTAHFSLVPNTAHAVTPAEAYLQSSTDLRSAPPFHHLNGYSRESFDECGDPWPESCSSSQGVCQFSGRAAQSASGPFDTIPFASQSPATTAFYSSSPFPILSVHSHASPVGYHQQSYDSTSPASHQMHGSLSPPPRHEGTRALQSLEMTPVPANKFSILPVPVSSPDSQSRSAFGLRNPLDTPAGPPRNLDHGRAMILADTVHAGVIGVNLTDVPDSDDLEVVHVESLANSSAENASLMKREVCTDEYSPVFPSEALRIAWEDTEKPRKRRGQFDEDARKETSATRSIGACVRCRAQRIRCSPNPNNPDGPCAPCSMVNKANKKTIHRIPCWRFKFVTMVLHRSGGLKYTRRFNHTQVVDVGDFADNEIIVVTMMQGLCKTPVRLELRRFREREGDEMFRRSAEGAVVKEQKLKPLCLANVEKTAKDFEKYIENNALDGLEEAVKNSDPIVKLTFDLIAKECRAAIKPGDKDGKQREFLRTVVKLWFAIRHETGSARIYGAEEGPEPSYAPRMVVAQFDSIRHERIYKKWKPAVLKSIESYLCSKNKDAWFTVYLASFLLLHQVSCTSSDRQRWANAHKQIMPLETRYGPIDHPFTALIENIQDGARSLLLYWQYFKRCDLMNIDWNKPRKTQLESLKPEQLSYMKTVVNLLKVKQKRGDIPTDPSQGCWDNELFWISHMFESAPSNDKKSDWKPPEIFSRANPSVGRNP